MPGLRVLARLVLAASVPAAGLLCLAGASTARADEPLPAWAAVPAVRRADPINLDFGIRAGFGYRFSGTSSFPITGRFGSMVGAFVAVAPAPVYAVGLGYEHSALGREHGHGDVADVDLSRTLDVVWASVRAVLVRTESLKLVAQIAPGLAFQHVTADALVYQTGGAAPVPFTCREGGGPGLGLRAGLGLEAPLTRALGVDLETVIDNLRLSSAPLGTCAPGAGTVSMVGLRLGFTYQLDVSRALR